MSEPLPQRGAPRSRKSHDAILAAALHLAETGGPNALSVEAIARAAGVGKQTIYRWWPNRVELLIEVYDTHAPTQQKLTAQARLDEVLITLFDMYRDGAAGALLAAIVAQSQSSTEAMAIFKDRFLVPRRDGLAHYLKISATTTPEHARQAADLVVAQIWYALLTDRSLLCEAYVEQICRSVETLSDPALQNVRIREGYVPGFGAAMVALHMAYYGPNWGLDRNFETHLFRDFSALMESYDPTLDQLIRLETAQGRILGMVVMEGSTQPEGHARVRFFIMDTALKGQGWGQKLLAQALNTCRKRGQTKLHLTTFKGLDAARTLYERAGFQLTEELEQDHWNGEGDTGEVRYELDLNDVPPAPQTSTDPEQLLMF